MTKLSMERLAQKVSDEIYEGDVEGELITREIADAVDTAEAIRRMETLRSEVDQALAILKGGA